jgi:alpha-tubulin suppressor-like RCC1 family protein
MPRGSSRWPAIRELDEPTQVPGTWKHVALQYLTTCAIRDGCWGQNIYGQARSAAGPPIVDSVQVSTDHFMAIASGFYFACGLRDDGAVLCWGYDANGELGDGTFADAHAPVQIGTDTWAHVAVGDVHTRAIRRDGAVFCWGENEHGQLGLARLHPPFLRLP